MDHPYIKYAAAVIMEHRGYLNIDEISDEDIINELETCVNSICLKYGKIQNDYAFFDYTNKEPNWTQSKENISNVVLSPHVVTSDAKGLYGKISVVREKLRTNGKSTGTLYASIMPTAKKYLQLNDKGNLSRKDIHLSYKDIALILITTLTPKKPCSSTWVKDSKSFVNTCIIPDFSIEATKDFVAIFNRLQKQKTEGLLQGKVYRKGKKKEVGRPLVFSGNYPNAASQYLQSISVLGFIGELAKEGEYSTKAHNVLKELEMNPILLVAPTPGLETASIIHYSHFIIELAKEGSLHKIIDSLFYARYYKYKGLKRTDTFQQYKKCGIEAGDKGKNIELEYYKFDYYAKNFLTLFNHYTFCEFLSCRMEYPTEIKTLLTSYFKNMEHISKEIIESAEAFGAWINRSAYSAALSDAYPGKSWSKLEKEMKEDEEKWNEVNRIIAEKKYKFLTNLESSIFSAADNTSMIANIMTQVGRLSNSDAPKEVKPFIEAVFTSSISFHSAKNLLIAFSRVHSKSTPSNNSISGEENSNNTFDSNNF